MYDNPPVVVNALIVDPDFHTKMVLLGVRGKPNGEGMSELIGGFVETGETLENAVRREVREEIKVEVSKLKYFGSFVGTYSDGRKLVSVVFTCHLEGEPSKTTETPKVFWTDQVPDDMFSDCDREALEMYFGGS